MPESTQHKLDRIRPPRVQITYDVEIGGAIQKKELPLVMGILADLSGKPEQALPKLKDRKFVEIDRDNFNDILKSIGPRVVCSVDNKLSKDGGKTSVDLKFEHIDDFSPLNVVNKVDSLAKLFQARQRLNDLLAKLDGNDTLDGMLQSVVGNADEMKQLKAANDGGKENA
ncbi:MAG TPA: type VI secretion system contractile sheath small subunit [Candidatus Angelobacter sp.]|nr:type VI secretion system contractile sheath small subunit [Candidatus Angelobacter sp.]